MTRANKTDAQPKGMKKPGGSAKKKNFDSDGFWKDLIERFFYNLLKRAMPELYEKADRSVPPRFLDKEFRDILNTGDPAIHSSPHFADFVLEVPLKNGDAEWVILHIEAQGRGGSNLAVRMYTYKSLIFAHYQREPAALVIITDKRPSKEPDYYSYSQYGTESLYKYNALVLWELDNEELLASDNPVDLVLYAAKFALERKGEHQKFNFLRETVKLLNGRGWNLQEKRDLLLFIERAVNIRDKVLITQYRKFLKQENKEGKAMYIPLILRDSAAEIEQRGIAKGVLKGKKEGKKEGIKEGKKEGKLEMVRNLLGNGIPPEVVAKSAGLSLRQIQRLTQ
ncbi:MAG: hypothetical protein LBP21_06230 [Synergistaceae bacterium]|jgi:predicted transposase/invertase (TIGR01784 family)|nr:hypothetical protein [Synergistaceae bacterium]